MVGWAMGCPFISSLQPSIRTHNRNLPPPPHPFVSPPLHSHTDPTLPNPPSPPKKTHITGSSSAAGGAHGGGPSSSPQAFCKENMLHAPTMARMLELRRQLTRLLNRWVGGWVSWVKLLVV